MTLLAARSMLLAFVGFLLGLALAALAAWVWSPADAAPPNRIESVVVYGSDPCPKSTNGAIVVCARRPETERYRIPKRFRGQKEAEKPSNKAWSSKVATGEDVSRVQGGLPNSCSAFGTGGQTGCFEQMQKQYHAEKQQQKQEEQDAEDGGPN